MNHEAYGQNASGPRTRILILCPLAREWSFLVSTFEPAIRVERLHDLKIKAAYIPDWRALVAPGGHGKTQFAVQAQCLIGQFPSTELVICAGAAGSLSLSNGKQSGPRIGMEKGPLTGIGTGLSR